jgi:K+/H+ antiporter YhaU regulatory subunit KhtT
MELPENFVYAGLSLDALALRQKTGASLVAVDRHSFTLQQVGPDTCLFPGDKILMLGEPYQIEKVQNLLLMESDSRQQSTLDSVLLESVQIGENSIAGDKSLQELQWPRKYDVQVAAVRRDGRTMLSPTAEFELISGDELLLIGPENGISKISEII